MLFEKIVFQEIYKYDVRRIASGWTDNETDFSSQFSVTK